MTPLSFCHLLTLCSFLGYRTSPSSCSEHDPEGLFIALIVVGRAFLCRGFRLPDIILMNLCLSLHSPSYILSLFAHL